MGLPPTSDRETRGLFQWSHRQLPPLDATGIGWYVHTIKEAFGSNVTSAPRDWSEAILRDTTRDLAKYMVSWASIHVKVAAELDLASLAPAGAWIESRLHKQYVEAVDPTSKNPKQVGTRRTDLIIYRRVLQYLLVGLILEFKYIKYPNFKEASKKMAVFREAFYQTAWYLVGANSLVGTRLAAPVVNTSFLRLFMLTSNTLIIEVSSDLADRAASINSIAELEGWDEFWQSGPTHDILLNGELNKSALAIYYELLAQGYILAASMTGALQGAGDAGDAAPPFHEAHIKRRHAWKNKSGQARSVTVTSTSTGSKGKSPKHSVNASSGSGDSAPDGDKNDEEEIISTNSDSADDDGHSESERDDKDPSWDEDPPWADDCDVEDLAAYDYSFLSRHIHNVKLVSSDDFSRLLHDHIAALNLPPLSAH
ncbi:uncharacterized protein CcaverHIS019_0212880 [Cutaneotrichosporon cavernicola]|uniref:Uncharacterized protein n=1 Tax=Cutaneotrichosporon cavernicola TaxID=279322 RepID=A0AA48IER6_9TREE|nr:uncharacterized protein CcaverHIS019_0212880 [Cutaneotrichosporon cavernicola]BEI89926.1 hypothetical protein CcaverHIS019_0212880 [Cutaneotrichosporon cavernicola]